MKIGRDAGWIWLSTADAGVRIHVDGNLEHHDASGMNGLENPATSLTRSACRVAPVFSNRLSTCVRTVVSEIPSALATSGMPPTSTIDKRTRNSVGVSR